MGGSKRSVPAKKRAPRKVFLSYAHKDAEFARALASVLAKLGRGFGYTVWTDEELAAGSNWALEVGRALENADAMVVILSPAWSESPWLRRELEYALTTKKLEGAVIPVLLRPTKEFPWILRTLQLLEADTDDPAHTAERIAKRIASRPDESRA